VAMINGEIQSVTHLWCVIWESDCNQQPCEPLARLLDSYRANQYGRISFIAEAP
jgi:hypothetical protein